MNSVNPLLQAVIDKLKENSYVPLFLGGKVNSILLYKIKNDDDLVPVGVLESHNSIGGDQQAKLTLEFHALGLNEELDLGELQSVAENFESILDHTVSLAQKAVKISYFEESEIQKLKTVAHNYEFDFTERFDALTDQISELRSAIPEVQAQLIGQMDPRLANLQNEIELLKNQNQVNSEKRTDLESQITALRSALGETDQRVLEHSSQLGTRLESADRQAVKFHSSLNARLDDFEKKMSQRQTLQGENTQKIVKLGGEIASLQVVVSEGSEDHQRISSMVHENQSRCLSNSTIISTLQSGFDRIEGLFKTNHQDMDQFKKKVSSQIEEDIARVKRVEGIVSDFRVEHRELEKCLEKHNQQISKNSGTIDDLRGPIQRNEHAARDNKKELTELMSDYVLLKEKVLNLQEISIQVQQNTNALKEGGSSSGTVDVESFRLLVQEELENFRSELEVLRESLTQSILSCEKGKDTSKIIENLKQVRKLLDDLFVDLEVSPPRRKFPKHRRGKLGKKRFRVSSFRGPGK